MKQRITYLVKDPDTFTPEKLAVKDGSLALDAIEAVKEHRLTFGLDELPTKLRNALKQWNELHIKWASSHPYTVVPPFTSRVTPGLHVFFDERTSVSEDALCSLLHSVFDSNLECSSTEETSTPLFYAPKDLRPDASQQYFSYLPSLDRLFAYIKENTCSASLKTCSLGAASLLEASYLDIDYNSASTNLILTAFWDSPPDGWTEHIPAPSGSQTTEIGVLTHEPNPDPYDIAFGGFLIVLGRDPTPKPTRFQTPTLHYPLLSSSLTYTTSFQQPIGMHRNLLLTFPSHSNLTPPEASCKLHTHLTLPSYLFIDRYQFSDPLFLSSHHLVSLVNISGATDLEAPDWVVKQWGSSSLFELGLPEEGYAGRGWNVSIPMHLRYLPAAEGGHTRIPLPWPVVFWACNAEHDGSGNPFHRTNLGYEQAFDGSLRFMHIPPVQNEELVEWLDVPVLDTRAAAWVQTGTIGVVILAFFGLCWVLFAGGKERVEGVKKKQ